MTASNLQLLFIAIVVIGFVVERILQWLNDRHRSTTLPDRLRDIYDEEEYARSQAYDKAKNRIGLLSSTLSTAILVTLLATEAFGLIYHFVGDITTHFIGQPLLFFALLGQASDIIGLPFSIYNTFVLEERFGFNKTTPATFIQDKLKGYLLGALIGGGLLALILWIYHAIPDYFWLLGWVLVSGFSLFFAVFYTSWIVPLFNKLTPLPDGELRTAIEAFANKVDFPLTNIYVMDSSKRSTKSNAYFSGMGKRKAIVLFDTLIEKHSTEELVAVLAHEIGHYKRKHIQQSIVLSILQTGVLFFLLDQLLGADVVAQALGYPEAAFPLNLLAFGLLFSPVSTLIGIAMNALNRKNEYEADAYAAEHYDAAPMQTALKQLSRDNLSNLEPHPAYVFVHYSHPPVLDRLAALDRQE